MLDLDTFGTKSTTNSRFADLLAGVSNASKIWDTVVCETEEYVVTPTLGSIVPNWLLVIPKVSAISFAGYAYPDGRRGVGPILRGIAELVGSDQMLWFEHGAAAPGSTIACGTDYAHIHVLIDPPFSLGAFSDEVMNRRQDWEVVDTERSHETLRCGMEFYAYGGLELSYLQQNVESGESQFFRKVVASLVGSDDQWDYKQYAHSENVRKTLRRFGNLANKPAVPLSAEI